MARTARLIELLLTLQRRPRFTVAELASAFGVSRRTMLRDLHDLSAMGVPLGATPGPGGGYTLLPEGRRLPLALTVNEATAMLLSCESFQHYAASPFAAQTLSAITKLRAALPPDAARASDRIRDHVAVTETERRYAAPLLPDLLRAALDGVWLRAVYDSRSGVGERAIFPFGLYAARGFWYCACHDARRGGAIGLRADRFVRIERIADRPPPAVPTLRDWLATRERDAPDPVRLRATLTRDGMMRFDSGAEFGEIVPTPDGGGVIDTNIPASEIAYFAARLLPLGGEIIVESPLDLIAALRDMARAVLARYDAESGNTNAGTSEDQAITGN